MAVTRYTFEVPGCPVPKERARAGKRGHYTPAKTVAYEAKVKLCALAAGVRRIEGPVFLGLEFYLPDARRRDGENMQKAIQDALNGVAYGDDSQVEKWHGTLYRKSATPRAVVTVEALAE